MKELLILQNTIMAYRQPVYNALAERYRVTVLHAGPKTVGENDRYREIIVPARRLGRFFLQRPRDVWQHVRKHDVVIAMFDLAWPAYLAPLYWRKRPKFILWGHWYSTSNLANHVRELLMKRADRILMYGEEEIERMVKSGIPPQKIVIAPNTIHVPNAKDYSKEPKKSLLFVGRLQSATRRNSKRVDLLIKAFARLQGRIDKDIVLDIVGDGDEKAKLATLALKLGVSEKINFHGHIDNPRVLRDLFSRAFAYISPGHVGLSVLQSFAHGVPVLTGKAIRQGQEAQHLKNILTGSPVVMGPEYYNLRHGENALLVESESELERAIEKICNEHEYAAKLGHNAYKHYTEKRTLDHMLEGFYSAIEG